MKKTRKLLAALLAIVMICSLMAACGTNEPASTEAPTQPATQADAPAETAAEESTEFSYPMSGKEISVTSYLPGEVTMAGYDNMGDTEFAKNVEALTGVHVNYRHQNGDWAEWINLMLADGNYDDVIQHWWTDYPGGAEGAYNDGIIIELNDVIDQYMPNFKAYMEAHPDIAKQVMTSEGKYYRIPSITADPRMSGTCGFFVRGDWMDELGIEMPTTIPQWHDALVKIKDEKGVTPICVGTDLLYCGTFLNAYSANYNWTNGCTIDAQTGEVVYMFTTDAYREFLTTMAAWYKEGLIDKDIATLSSDVVKAKLLNDEAAVSFGWVGGTIQAVTLTGKETNPSFTLRALDGASADDNSTVIYKKDVSQVNTMGAAITTSCKDVEAAARYLDFFWSEEGILASNYGVEGVTYNMVDGVPTYTDEILNNEMGMDAAMGKYIRAYGAFPGIQDWYYLMGRYVTDEAKDALATWGGAGNFCGDVPPSLSFTSEESETIGRVNADITTYTDEMIIKFLLGTEDIDAKWDEYVATVNSFGLQDMVDAVQAAYDRYMA